jgi:hypothetical protein
VFIFDTYIKHSSARKGRRRFWGKFQEVTIPHIETVHRNLNKSKQTAFLLNSSKQN